MSTEHERKLNLAKQRRFQERHPDYDRKRFKLRSIRACRFGSNWNLFRTYELADPRDEEQKPLLIGYCLRGGPPWESLWKVKDVSYGLWASWMRDLAALRLTPVDKVGWALGRVAPLSRLLARYLVRERLKLIRTEGQPTWLLNLPRGRIARVHEDGRVQRYSSITNATQLTGLLMRDIAWWVDEVRGRDGWKWFEDRCFEDQQ